MALFKSCCVTLGFPWVFLVFVLVSCSTPVNARVAESTPTLVKQGTLELGVVEASPFVFHGALYRLEWFRAGECLRVVKFATGQEVARFASGYSFPCVLVEDNIVSVLATLLNQPSGGNVLGLFQSTDLETWIPYPEVYRNEDLVFDNTSVVKTPTGYVLSLEVNQWSRANPPVSFAARFMVSPDLLNWTLLSIEHQHGYDHYTAPHLLRYCDGWYYLFYLEAGKAHGYEQYLDRSRDFVTWVSSPANPVLAASAQDRQISGTLTADEIVKVNAAADINNSDIDFCSQNGKLIFTYSWGNQTGTELLAWATWDSSEADFLTYWFR